MRKQPPLNPDHLRQRPVKGTVGQSSYHESAQLHVSGRAEYLDDRPLLPGSLHLAVGKSSQAHARILNMDLEPVRQSPGVVAVFTAADIPGELDVGPVFPGDPLLADQQVDYLGQPLFVVAAQSLRQARQAALLAKIDYETLPAILEVETALEQAFYVRPAHQMQTGDVDTAMATAPLQLQGALKVGGQEHFYLEGQVARVEPTDDGGVRVYSSTQHPTEVQALVAGVLGLSMHRVVVETRRMGGGFGGKETQAAPLACLCALVCFLTGRPAHYRMPRQDDMEITGKRHDFLHRYQLGFNEQGRILAANFQLAGRCGYSADLSDAIVDRAMFHADNAYHLNQARVLGERCKTHTASNTAFRGFGGPQGMLLIEHLMDDIACHLQLDPLDVRLRNLYRLQERNQTHYGQPIEDDRLFEVITQLEETSHYRSRQAEIRAFNQTSRWLKKGLALTPVKFGISFTLQHLNQAGALLHLYTDGSIQINHGGTEMGQGLFTKVAQVVATEFQVDLEQIAVTATRTDKVPNTSPTAASSGSDLNGLAALDACRKIKQRLIDFAAEHFAVDKEAVRFAHNLVEIGEQTLGFAEFLQLAYQQRIALSDTGYYRTPKIYYDRDQTKGRPFFYFAVGASVSEVEVDTLTGEYRVTAVDILHDAGHSLNPALDRGQIEGGFVQGMGWLTSEELVWNEQGRLLSNNPATYKIPTAADVPEHFKVALFDAPNTETNLYRSKAIGEPPLMLAMSVWSALRAAISSVSDYQVNPRLDTPATPERVLKAIEEAAACKQ